MGTKRPHADVHLGSIFLGPKAENADVFERLLLEALRDHVFFRRNFHPEDGFTLSELDRRDPAYQDSLSLLSQELLGLLGELKEDVPFFSPRHIGHMSSDITMASFIGYFATMLHNPNNVAAEASPVTTRLEYEVAAGLAAMVGYPADRHWGHLTSGGTIANFEALAIARNVKYLPLALRWAAEELGVQVDVQLPRGERAPLAELDLWRAINVAPEAALDAADRFQAAVGNSWRAHEALSRWSLSGLGFQQFERRLAECFGDVLPPAVVLVPSTAHYSWEKICRALGIGAAQVVQVPVDERFRMSVEGLQDALEALARRRQAVAAVITVAGTTEESAVDRVDRLVALRRSAGRELGLAFTLHADAAWGGYAASITRGRDGARRSFEAARADYAPEDWPEEDVYRALCALEETDSITIDPHKLGFTPYPAGAICFRDRRVRNLVAVEAPYVFAGERSDLGRYIFEGSKPGAAAAAVWLSHRVLPLNAAGYGRLIGETARGARKLHRALEQASFHPFRIVLLPHTDLNIVCFTFGHPELFSLEEINAFIDRLHGAMSTAGGRPARQLDYFVSSTVLRTGEYGKAVEPLVRELGFSADDYRRAGGLSVLRCTVMNPFATAGTDKVDFLAGFVQTLQQVLGERLGAGSGSGARAPLT